MIIYFKDVFIVNIILFVRKYVFLKSLNWGIKKQNIFEGEFDVDIFCVYIIINL